MKSLRNWLRHAFGLTKGEIVTITTPDAKLLVGFLCFECGKLHDVHESYTQYSVEDWLANRYDNHYR